MRIARVTHDTAAAFFGAHARVHAPVCEPA